MTDIAICTFDSLKELLSGYFQVRRGRMVLIPGVLGIVLMIMLQEMGSISTEIMWGATAGILAAEGIFLYLLYKIPLGEGRKLTIIWKGYKQNDKEIYKKLVNLEEKNLFPWEKKNWWKYQYYLLMRMGSIRKAEGLLRKWTSQESADYYMFRSFQSEAAADMDGAIFYMQKAKDVVREKDYFLRVQILGNYGRLMVLSGNYQDADFYFKKAKDLKKVETDEHLWHPIYTNLLINWCRLGKSREEIDRGLQEYVSLLNMKKMENILEYNNLQLSLARQLNDGEWLERAIADGFEEMIRLDLTDRQKVAYLGSMARMVCTARTSPERCLEEILKNEQLIFQCPMPERFAAIKQMGYMFRTLYYPRYDKVREKVLTYLRQQAVSDLETYIDQLPEEAVFERCNWMMDLCGVQKQYLENLDFMRLIQQMEWVRDTYLQNGLKVDAMKVDIHIADECTAPVNLDRNLIPIHKDKMLQHVMQAEEMLGNMKKNPLLAEDWLNLSYQNYHLMRYKQCREHFRKFQDCNVALGHFTPEFQMLYRACELLNRILDFYEKWKMLEQDVYRQQKLSREAQKWFQNPWTKREIGISLLLAKYLDYDFVILKTRTWYEKHEGVIQPIMHTWLCTNMGNLEVDLTYSQFSAEEEQQRLFFSTDRHPMETGESITVRQGVRKKEECGNTVMRRCAFDVNFENGMLGEILREIML